MNDTNETIIAARQLTRSFGALTAVDDLSFQVRRGEIFGLVGPDGAGKTTTLRLLCGLLDPTSGEVEVAGFDVSKSLDAVKDRIGYMAQRFGLYGDLSVEENMLFYADLFDVAGTRREELMGGLLLMTRMAPFRTRQAAKLSGGMKQKLALMCTLLHRPEILILDEPTCGVDPVSRRDFWAILYQLVRDGMTVVITTAYLDEAERCNRVGLLYKGRFITCEKPDVIKTNLNLKCCEIEVSNTRAAREVLSAIDGVISAEPFGAALHVFYSPARVTLGEVERRLESRGLGPAVFREVSPTLEDVFIALVQKENSGGEEARA